MLLHSLKLVAYNRFSLVFFLPISTLMGSDVIGSGNKVVPAKGFASGDNGSEQVISKSVEDSLVI